MCTTIFNTFPRAVITAFLEHSGFRDVPLNIRLFEGEKGGLAMSEFMALVAPHTHRWRTCRLDDVDPLPLAPFLSNSAPLLESLDINYSVYFEPLHYGATDGLQTFSVLFDNHTPYLQRLGFGSVFMPFTHPVFSNLRSLDLRNIVYGKADSLQQFIQLLASSSLLERVVLDAVYFSVASGDGRPPAEPTTPQIALSHLQKFFIYADAGLGWLPRYIFSHIVTPPFSHIGVFGYLDQGGGIERVIPEYTESQPGLASLPRVESCPSAGISSLLLSK